MAMEIPTRHSLRQPPRICVDPVELREETQKLLDAPVGTLYAGQATADGGREEAYDLAYDTIKKAEYLQFGHASQVAGTIYSEQLREAGTVELVEDLEAITFMKPIIDRMQQEGTMYLELRQQKQGSRPSEADFGGVAGGTNMDAGYLSSSDDDSSSSSDEDSDNEAAAENSPPALDFSPPGPTAKLQEALLDAMACAGGQTHPLEYYEMAMTIIEGGDIDKGTNTYTLPSHVTYNAALRGISKCDLSEEPLRDEALSCAFSLYNHLSHSLHLPRNAATFYYMLQNVDNIFPASRVKGNICVTLWDHASRMGVADARFVDTLKKVLGNGNGPEFDILLHELSVKIPQKYHRFAKKYRNGDNY